MLVQTNGSSPYSDSYSSSSFSYTSEEQQTPYASIQISQIKSDYIAIAQDLTPTERKLYNSLIYTENYEAAKGIIAVGFLRSVGMYQNSEGKPLTGISLMQDLTQLNPPPGEKERSSLSALQNHLSQNPLSLQFDKERLGNLLDLRI
ncbi:MAG: hypothetical protein M0P91_13660 [Sulfuricurvum sp.]|uniref:hypothetical protein n=1 Tax=Sulfuricurvum sp. TaxID=2025608 RepID=UPI0025F461F3|nr:hypothetical protein [Sulfuricurvum sp.]MCK9374223.1 hypothetical protein [Sulfuricurvum sp.]